MKVNKATHSGEFQREKLIVGEYSGLQGTASLLHLHIMCQLHSLGFRMVFDLHSSTSYIPDIALGRIYVP